MNMVKYFVYFFVVQPVPRDMTNVVMVPNEQCDPQNNLL